ncbi:MAG: VanZ family protein [Raoultibacter sp.]
MDFLHTPKRTCSTGFTVVSWLCVVAWAGFIFFMSSNTGDNLDQGLGFFSSIYQIMQTIQTGLLGPGVDVLSPAAHFCEYAVFGILWVNALYCHIPLARACLVAVACVSLYGATDEIHQIFVADRMCDPADWLVDTIGACLGASLALFVLTVRKGARAALPGDR